MATREPIYAALWTLITSASGIQGQFVKTGRLLKHVEDVSPAEMPALFMIQRGEAWQRVDAGRGVLRKRTLNAALIFYVNASSGAGVLPATLMNNAMDTLDDLFNNATRVQTLGGLVEWVHCPADGAVTYYEGLLQDKSPVVVPISILIP